MPKNIATAWYEFCAYVYMYMLWKCVKVQLLLPCLVWKANQNSVSTARSWIEAAVEVPLHGAKEQKKGKRKERAGEWVSGEFKDRATERGNSTQRQQQSEREWNRDIEMKVLWRKRRGLLTYVNWVSLGLWPAIDLSLV